MNRRARCIDIRAIRAASLVIALLWTSGQEVRATSCRRPPDLEVLYPAEGEAARVDSVVLLRSHGISRFSASRWLTLTDQRGQTVVAEVVAPRSSQLIRLVPDKPLTPGENYQVMHRERQLRRFDVQKGRWGRKQPRRVRATIKFSDEITVGHMYGTGRGKVRRAWILPMPAKHAVVLEVVPLLRQRGRLRISEKDAARLRLLNSLRAERNLSNAEWSEFHRLKEEARQLRGLTQVTGWSDRVEIAEFGLCTTKPAAPAKGPYAIRVTPWSRTGQQGPPLVLQGRIERDAVVQVRNRIETIAQVSKTVGKRGGKVNVGRLTVHVAPAKDRGREPVKVRVVQQRVEPSEGQAQLSRKMYRPFGDVFTVEFEPQLAPGSINLIFSYEPAEIPKGFSERNLAALLFRDGLPPYPGHPTDTLPLVAEVDTARRRVYPELDGATAGTFQLMAMKKRPDVDGNISFWP